MKWCTVFNKYVTPLAVIILICLLAFLGSFERWELNLYSTWFKLRGEVNPGADIIIIAVDEKSIEKIGPACLAAVSACPAAEPAPEAKVVVFDMLFDVPGEAGADSEFARAVKQHGHVVLASTFRYESNGWSMVSRAPLPRKTTGQEVVPAFCFINMPEDTDGVIRNMTAVDTNTFKKPYPSLSIAAVLACDGLNPNALSLAEPGVLLAGSRRLPLEYSNNQVLFNYWGG